MIRRMPQNQQNIFLSFSIHVTHGNINSMIVQTGSSRKRIVQKKQAGIFHHGDLRSSLINCAIRNIAKKGDVDFTLRAMAEEIGVSHASVFRHFATKAHLLAEIAKIGYQTLGERLRDYKKKSSNPFGSIHIYFEFARDNEGLFRAMFHPSIKPFENFPGLIEAANSAIVPLFSLFSSQDLRKSEPQALLSWAVAHGLAILAIDGQIPGPFSHHKNDLDAMVNQAVRTLSDRKPNP